MLGLLPAQTQRRPCRSPAGSSGFLRVVCMACGLTGSKRTVCGSTVPSCLSSWLNNRRQMVQLAEGMEGELHWRQWVVELHTAASQGSQWGQKWPTNLVCYLLRADLPTVQQSARLSDACFPSLPRWDLFPAQPGRPRGDSLGGRHRRAPALWLPTTLCFSDEWGLPQRPAEHREGLVSH